MEKTFLELEMVTKPRKRYVTLEWSSEAKIEAERYENNTSDFSVPTTRDDSYSSNVKVRFFKYQTCVIGKAFSPVCLRIQQPIGSFCKSARYRDSISLANCHKSKEPGLNIVKTTEKWDYILGNLDLDLDKNYLGPYGTIPSRNILDK